MIGSVFKNVIAASLVLPMVCITKSVTISSGGLFTSNTLVKWASPLAECVSRYKCTLSNLKWSVTHRGLHSGWSAFTEHTARAECVTLTAMTLKARYVWCIKKHFFVIARSEATQQRNVIRCNSAACCHLVCCENSG